MTWTGAVRVHVPVPAAKVGHARDLDAGGVGPGQLRAVGREGDVARRAAHRKLAEVGHVRGHGALVASHDDPLRAVRGAGPLDRHQRPHGRHHGAAEVDPLRDLQPALVGGGEHARELTRAARGCDRQKPRTTPRLAGELGK